MEFNRDLCLRILREAGCSKGLINHCIAVAELARGLAVACREAGIIVDVEIVEFGALLHDVGKAKTAGIEHALRGAEFVSKYDPPRLVLKIIENHVGAGIPKEEAEQIGLPPRDYLPRSIEEKIVSFADKLVERNKVVLPRVARSRLSERLGKNHPATQRFDDLSGVFTNVDPIRHYLERITGRSLVQ